MASSSKTVCDCKPEQPACAACIKTATLRPFQGRKTPDWQGKVATLVQDLRGHKAGKDWQCECIGNLMCVRCQVTLGMRAYRAGQDDVIEAVQEVRARKGLN